MTIRGPTNVKTACRANAAGHCNQHLHAAAGRDAGSGPANNHVNVGAMADLAHVTNDGTS